MNSVSALEELCSEFQVLAYGPAATKEAAKGLLGRGRSIYVSYREGLRAKGLWDLEIVSRALSLKCIDSDW